MISGHFLLLKTTELLYIGDAFLSVILYPVTIGLD